MDAAKLQIIFDLKNFLINISSNTELWRSSVVSEKAFTRNRCLSFDRLVLMILNLPKRSLSIEIHSFFSHIQHKSCTKAAFCLQRAKLKPFFFELWNKVLTHSFYQHYADKVKLWKNFVLLAFDGSVLSLPDTSELSAVYQRTSNQKGENGPAARACVMYDVLNKLIIKTTLLSYLITERSAVMEQLEYAPENSLLIFDRGYPCFWLFYMLLQKHHKFVMRIRLDYGNVVKEFVKSSDKDCIKIFRPTDKNIKKLKQLGINLSKETTIKLRLVKIPLKTGETEVLVTNLYSSEDYSINDLKEVYFLRWGVETCFSTLKNQLQIENFSGIRKLCIEQDFFANLFVYNLQSIIEKESEQVVAKVCYNRKYTYQINKNISWAFLKDRLIDLFIEENPRQILLELQTLFRQHLEPVRHNRSYPRIRKTINKNRKYRTLTNYKRAL